MLSFLKLTEEMKNAEEAASSGAIEMPLDLVGLRRR
jgi:hypothetical protein